MKRIDGSYTTAMTQIGRIWVYLGKIALIVNNHSRSLPKGVPAELERELKTTCDLAHLSLKRLWDTPPFEKVPTEFVDNLRIVADCLEQRLVDLGYDTEM